MNLFDIVKRKDRCLQLVCGTVEPVRRGGADGYLGVRFAPGARLKLVDAQEFTRLRTLPRDIGWKLRMPGEAGGAASFSISVCDPASGRESLLHRWSAHDGATATPLLLTWPLWVSRVPRCDLLLANEGGEAVELQTSPLFDSRAALTELIRGVGIEVGPGLNPHVRPGAAVEVKYIEALPVEHWVANYVKDRPMSGDPQLWQHYVIGDAQQLECCDDGSLDFIFSHHVFEHLMNPLGVLRNWSRKLKRDGAMVAVIPDLRYCFDLRQSPSTPAEWLAEYESGTWQLTATQYEKWCRHTAPYNTPDDLIRRKYSIHVHYYTPAAFHELAEMGIKRGFFSALHLNTSPNNRDFGVVLWR